MFVLYTAALLKLVRDRGLLPHAYANNTHILGICPSLKADRLQNDVSACLDAGRTSRYKSNYSPGRTVADAERDLLAIAKFLVYIVLPMA